MKPVLALAAGVLLLSGPANAADPAMLKRGKEVFDYWCDSCHGPGVGRPGTIALDALYDGEVPALLEERTDLSPDTVKSFVRTGVSIMPFFRKVEIGDTDLEALAAYLSRNLTEPR